MIGAAASELEVHVGRQIRRRRRIMDMTQQDLAEKGGVCFQSMQKYENAENRIYVGRLWEIAKALDVPVSYFFEGQQERTAA